MRFNLMTKRIALISEHASPLGTFGGADSGGQNVYIGHLAQRLAALGYEVDIFTRRDSDQLPEVLEWFDGVRIIHVPAGPHKYVRKEDLLPYMEEFTVYVLAFCQHSRLETYSLVHANFWMSAMVAAEIKRTLGLPFVVTFHALGRVRRFYQGEADEFPDERFAIEDRIVAEADYIIAACPQDREDLLRLYHANPEKIRIIPCGFDPCEFWQVDRALSRSKLGLQPEELVILQLGRLVPRKGVDTVIRSLARLLKQHITARLLIVGGESEEPDLCRTPEIGRLQTIAQEEGVLEWVTFVGCRCREALKYYYSAVDVFVTTPWYEPFGITPVEAMACGTPVIGSNVGGIKYTVKDGETGYLVPPNDPDAVAECIAYLYKNPQKRAQLGASGMQRAQQLFTWQQVTTAVANLYEEVLAISSPPPLLPYLSLIDHSFDAALAAMERSRLQLGPAILQVAQTIFNCFAAGGKVLVCGNGGSAADAQHFVAELVGRFRGLNRPGLPALALTADTAFLTAWANDIGYDYVFARQVETLAKTGDLVLAISTSGRSRNLIEAFVAARSQHLRCVALLGGDGGELLGLADVAVVVPVTDTQRIQEVQLLVLHILCELIEAQWGERREQGRQGEQGGERNLSTSS